MAGPILYSTNPWIAHDLSVRYLGGKHFAWCSEIFDPTTAATASAGAAIAPSSSPRQIFDRLYDDCTGEEKHSALIGRYKRTFRRLATNWLASKTIDAKQYAEITGLVNAQSWRPWRPILYVVPRQPIETAGRLVAVPPPLRAGYGPEFQISELLPPEFDIIESQLR